MALLYKKKFNRVELKSCNTADEITSAVFHVYRFIQEKWTTSPYAVGLVQAPFSAREGAMEFKEAMTSFHKKHVSFVSVHGITTNLIKAVKARFLFLNPMWRETPADTAVADMDCTFKFDYEGRNLPPAGNWEWAAIPHFLLSLAPLGRKKTLPLLDNSLSVVEAIPPCWQKLARALDSLPEIYWDYRSPAVTDLPGVESVSLSLTDEEEDSHDVAHDEQPLVPVVHQVYQPAPEFYHVMHIVRTLFGKFEKNKLPWSYSRSY